jgi:3-oxoacyl-[acyl-carrier-protein] synthase-3
MNVLIPAAWGCGVRIVSTGSYLPERVMTNADLVAAGAAMDADEIERLSGIQQRHWATPEQATSDLAIAACRLAMERAALAPADIDRLIIGTVSPDYPTPATACLVHAGLGLGPVPAYDLTAACSGFLYALDAGARAVMTGDQHVLAGAADMRSRYLDLSDRATCGLFGDGAGAAVLAPGPVGSGLVGLVLFADGQGAHTIYVPAGGTREPASAETVAARRHAIHMADGPRLYVQAVSGMLHAATSLLDALNLSFADIDMVIPHQANAHIIRRLAWKAKIPLERVYSNIERVGNISGATVPVALDEAWQAGRIQPGCKVLLVAAGAGHTAGAALYVA